MFLNKQTTPPPTPEPNGIEIKLRLSEATLVKLIPFVIAIFLGSGVWVHTTQSAPLPANSSSDITEVTP